MSNIDQITDEDELHKLLGEVDNFDERKKIRARLKELREKAREEYEARRKQREAESADVVKMRFQQQEELKKKKMQQYQNIAAQPTCDRESSFVKGSESLLQDKQRWAEEEKQKKLEAYSKITGHHGTTRSDGSSITTTVTTDKSKDGNQTTVTKRTETTVSKTSGMGGIQYGAPKGGAEQMANQLAGQLIKASGPGTSGRITVNTESWSSRDGLVNKSHKTETWGAKPTGAKGAMAAFKQMDSSNNPTPNKPNFAGGGGGGGKGMVRSPSAIKQMLLEWCKSKTREYENVEVTNFSSCWNNGLAFCALIHHFYPDAFDYSKLEPKNRRYNFTLAFDTAEKLADIAPLLDVEDMVRMKNPDWKCVFTYVQSFYRKLRDHDANKASAQAEQ